MPLAKEVFMFLLKFPKADDPKMQELEGLVRTGSILFLGFWAVSQWFYDCILNRIRSAKTARDYKHPS